MLADIPLAVVQKRLRYASSTSPLGGGQKPPWDPDCRRQCRTDLDRVRGPAEGVLLDVGCCVATANRGDTFAHGRRHSIGLNVL